MSLASVAVTAFGAGYLCLAVITNGAVGRVSTFLLVMLLTTGPLFLIDGFWGVATNTMKFGNRVMRGKGANYASTIIGVLGAGATALGLLFLITIIAG